MRKLIWKFVLIIGLLALCVWSFYPPGEKIRLGRDLRGGVSLIYHVRLEPDDPDPASTVAQVISVLKDRVNPSGILDISMVPLGVDRIEIVMPLPNENVIALRDAYEAALDNLLHDAQISPSELQTALGDGTAIERFGGGEGERRDQIAGLQAAFDTHQASVDALEEAMQRGGADIQTLGPLEQAVADAQIDFEDLRETVLRLSLSRARAERTLRLSKDSRDLKDSQGNVVYDAETGDPVPGPSARELELQSIKDRFPYLADAVDQLVIDYDAYAAVRTGFDDPEDLMRLLRGAGVLEFRIGVRNSDPQGVNPGDLRTQLDLLGPENTDSPVAKWFPINDLKQWYEEAEDLALLQADPIAYFAGRGYDLVAAERDSKYYLLLYTTEAKTLTHEGGRVWQIVRAYRTFDNFGRPAIGFQLDGPGGREMNRLTGPNVNEPMAILLDGQVYSAPNINSAIGANGQIVGNFSESEVNYLVRLLAAGSLKARLSPEPIATNTLGPSIGQDNLARGMQAFVWAIIAVAAFMMAYYFFAGVVADLALLANGIIIFGVMAMIDGTFTLPGMAGIVLTIGMAVDANVLIYERIREELFSGEVDLRAAIRRGYAKALSTILDANVTNLIVCAVLYKTATTEVKGFALTLSIGIFATLFTALFVTRAIYALYTDVAQIRRLPMLPTVFQGIHRFLSPSINWIGMRHVFWTMSAIAVVCSITMVASRGVEMLDTEFRGGVAVTMLTAKDGDSRLLLPHTGPDGVETRVQSQSTLLDAGTPQRERDQFLARLRSAGVATETAEDLATIRKILNELAKTNVVTTGGTEIRDGVVHATGFQFKVARPKDLDKEATTTAVVVEAIVAEFGDLLDVTLPLTFDGMDSPNHAAYTWPITKDVLGDNIDRRRFRDQVSDFLGGVVIVVDDIDPPVTVEEVKKRVLRMRSQPDFESIIGRDVGVFGLEMAESGNPARGFRSVAICVYDPRLSIAKVDFDLWDSNLAAPEWRLVSQALQRRTSLEQVSDFSAAVAETLSAKALVAVVLSLLGIMVYIWIRFGSLRYSAAAIVALAHDVCIALGVLAVTATIGRTALASMFLIEEFRIDLGVVAALLTIIGYSLNDTIVILDRIRENRGKLPIPTADIVNRSINQTISRTVLTSLTTLLAVSIMFAAGGGGIRPFAFTLLIGLIVGTYSSVAIAAPLVFKGGTAKAAGASTETHEANTAHKQLPTDRAAAAST